LFANEAEASLDAEEIFKKLAVEFKSTIKFSLSKPNDGLGYFSKLAEYMGID